MSLKLEPNEVCPHSNVCPYAEDPTTGQFCQGTVARKHPFVCDYVQNGRISEGTMRNRNDLTGRMKVLVE